MYPSPYHASWSAPQQGDPISRPEKSRPDRLDALVRNLCDTLGIPATQPLITTEQAAQLLLLQKGTLDKWRSTQPDKLPFVKSGRLVRYRVMDVACFILGDSAQKS